MTAAPTRTDIDTFDDLIEVAASLPGSRTAAVAGRIRTLVRADGRGAA